MAAPSLVTVEQVERALRELPGWTRVGVELRCSYRLPDFGAAVAFTLRIAEVAEELDHHPEWTVSYRRVRVATTTHDAGGLTRRDLELAERIVALAVAAGAAVVPASDG